MGRNESKWGGDNLKETKCEGKLGRSAKLKDNKCEKKPGEVVRTDRKREWREAEPSTAIEDQFYCSKTSVPDVNPNPEQLLICFAGRFYHTPNPQVRTLRY